MTKNIKIIDLILIFTIFYHVFLTSYWTMSHTGGTWSKIGFSLIALLAGVSFINFLEEKFTIKTFSLVFLAECLIVFCFYKHDIDMIKFFIICFASAQLDVKEILRDYFIGIIIGVFFVFSLFLLGILPKVNDFGLLSYGFRNPNSLGFLLFVLFGILIIFFHTKKYFISLMFVIMLPFEYFMLEDHTAAILFTLAYFLYLISPLWKKIISLRVSKWILSALPLFLTYISMWIGQNYFAYYWMPRLNEVFTSRPALWNFYLSNFRITKFGIKLPENINFGHGAFDGAYVTYPMLHGYIIFGVMLILLFVGLFYITKNEYSYVLSFALILAVYSFSENAPFINLYSPLFAVCLSVIATGNTSAQSLKKSDRSISKIHKNN